MACFTLGLLADSDILDPGGIMILNAMAWIAFVMLTSAQIVLFAVPRRLALVVSQMDATAGALNLN
jgi:hypothetical protein